MDRSRLLAHSDDEEYGMEESTSRSHTFRRPLPQPRRFLLQRNNNNDYQQVPSIATDDMNNEDDDNSEDLEAPASLMLEEQEQNPPLGQDNELPHPATTSTKSTRQHMTIHDRTTWRWANVNDLDDFFKRVYDYYMGRGMYCILLARFLNLLTLAFVIGFSTFLIGCVEYSEIPNHSSLSDVLVPQCISRLSGTKTMFLVIFILWWIWQALRFILDWPALKEMHEFYYHLLEIPDEDIQTVAWQTVLERITKIHEDNPTTASTSPYRVDEHAVTSRIMRQENYLIALFNKRKLDITIPLPVLRNMRMFTRDLEWNVAFCVLSFVFNERGQLRKRFLQEKNRHLLAEGLRRRFIFMGLLNFLFLPFILVYLLAFFFFRYFEEYHKNPSEIGTRAFSPYAKWKFREFNELPHFFKARLSSCNGLANKYVDQFPKEKSALVARFVAFISGSFAGVLAIVTLFDSEALLNFEISPNGTILFYLGLFGTVFAVSRGMIPDEHLIFEPEELLQQVMKFTHYCPEEWRGKLHTDEVRGQFCQLFTYKVLLFVQELFSVIFTPLVLCFSLPKSAEQIIDAFREFTVHVDGLGYVCSFSQFDFNKHGDAKYGAQTHAEEEHLMSNDGKMEKSFLNFKANNPGWEPTDIEGSMYLTRISEFQRSRRARDEPSSSSSASPRGTARPLRLNQFGVPEGHEPSNLGDSFTRTTHDVVPWEPEEEDEEDDGHDHNQQREQRHRIIGLLNEVYDLNNKPTP
ncbi:autophagy protein Apg9-domain-containing protein [Phascolomyces articulosus]|uniref:Autophagy-related protein 9 n=1 Tax=Phascolomyces articulosus TaxID=60185 RepID=A0AAD5JTT2_9FUNG|nr:autophagy protein Apg9-domain-containing protein [Phascolomyces articulosus]